MGDDSTPALPIARFEWLDSSNVEAGCDQDDVAGKVHALVSSVGFHLKEEDRHLRLVLSAYGIGDGRHFSGVTIIPKCSVTRRETFTSS